MARMHLEDRLSPLLVRQVHNNASIESPRAQQRFVEHVGLIRRGEHDDPLTAREAIHLSEELVERLLLFARAAERELTARTPDRVQLVDEVDGRRIVARLLEEVSDSRRADADDHFDEL